MSAPAVVPQARIEWLETPQANAEAVLRAVRVLRAHTLHLEGGPIYGLTGSPLPAEGEASGAPACDPAGPTKEATNVPAGSRKGASAPNLCGNLGCPLVLGHSGLCAIEGQFGRRSVATNGAATCAPVGNPLPAAPAPARAPSRAAASPVPRPSPPPMEQPPPRQQPAPKPPPSQRPPPKVQPPRRTPPPPRPQPQQPSPPPDSPQPEREPVPQEQARGGSPPRCAGCVAAAPADCVASAAATAGGPARGQDLSGACGGPSTPAQAAVPDSRPTAAVADLEPSRDPPVSSEHDEKWTQEQTRAALGWRVSVYWAGNRQWFEGEIVRVSASGANRCMVLYDVDKQRKWHRLWEDEFVWLGRAGGRALSGPGRPGAPSTPAAQASAEEASPSDDSEDDVPLTMRAQQRGGVVRPPASGGLPGPAVASPDGAMQSHAVPSSSGAAPPDLEAARQLLADLEDRIPFVHVSRAFAREVRKWRVGLDDAATPTEVAKKLVTLRAHMLEESAAGESLIREDWRRGSGRYVEWKREAQHGPMDLTTLVRLISELDASRASAHDIGVDSAASAADQRARRQVRSLDTEEAVPKRSAPPAQPASSPKRRRLRNKPSTPLAGKKPPAPSQQKRPWRAAQAQASVGWRVRVWWEGDQCFYNGRIGKYRPGTAAVKVYYDDGWRKWYLLWEENFVWKAAPDSSPAPARSQQRDRHRATVAEADAVTSTSASQAAEGSFAQNYRPCGRKTGPPSFFTPSPSRCNCSQSDRTNKQCADPCCANYDYYDAMKLTSGGKVIRLNDGLRILPQEGTKEPFLVAMFGGVRVSRQDGRVEFVARYFCRAVDSYVQQEFAWHRSPFFGWSPRPPASCVYRLIDDGGNWISEWDTVSAVMSKCTVVQVTRRQLREFCNRSAGKPADRLTEFFYAHTWSAFTGAEPQLIGTGRLSDDESSSSDDEDEQPLRVRRKGRDAAAAKSSAPMDASLGPSAGRYRIKRSSKPAQPGDAVVEEVPCKEHEIHESLCAVCHADDRRELLVCKGGCLRVFHLECAGITTGDDREMLQRLHQENGWQCSDCRAGKLACFVCKKMGTLNSEVFRCGFRVGGVPACGKVRERADPTRRPLISVSALTRPACPATRSTTPSASRALISRASSARCTTAPCAGLCLSPSLFRGTTWPSTSSACLDGLLHSLRSRRSVRLVRCICCTRSFCNKDACLPAKHRRLGTSSLVCDTSRPHHDLDALVQRHQPTPLESARLGAELVHLIQPEAGDAFAGVFYRAGLGQRCLTEGRAPIGGGEGAESEFFGADERLSMDVLRTLPSCDASDEARARMAKRPRQQLSIAPTVLPAGGPTVPERLRGGGRSALMTASVVPAHGGDERVEVRMVDAQTELYTCPRRAAFPTLQTPDHRVTEKIWRAVSTSSKPDSAGRDSVVSQIVQARDPSSSLFFQIILFYDLISPRHHRTNLTPKRCVLRRMAWLSTRSVG